MAVCWDYLKVIGEAYPRILQHATEDSAEGYDWIGRDGKPYHRERQNAKMMWANAFCNADKDTLIKNPWMVNYHTFMIYLMSFGFIPRKDWIIWAGSFVNTHKVPICTESLIVAPSVELRRLIRGTRTSYTREGSYPNVLPYHGKTKCSFGIYSNLPDGTPYKTTSDSALEMAITWSKDRVAQLKHLKWHRGGEFPTSQMQYLVHEKDRDHYHHFINPCSPRVALKWLITAEQRILADRLDEDKGIEPKLDLVPSDPFPVDPKARISRKINKAVNPMDKIHGKVLFL